MRNKKGFTLTEVLLAVMIVGVVGVALAALTGAAMRQSGVGRTRMMLRNQISTALRQLRQDVHMASNVGDCDNTKWTLRQERSIGPNHVTGDVLITYQYNGDSNSITRIDQNGEEEWLGNIIRVEGMPPMCQALYSGNGIKSMIRITLVTGINSTPPVTETIQEIFTLPHGLGNSNSAN